MNRLLAITLAALLATGGIARATKLTDRYIALGHLSTYKDLANGGHIFLKAGTFKPCEGYETLVGPASNGRNGIDPIGRLKVGLPWDKKSGMATLVVDAFWNAQLDMLNRIKAGEDVCEQIAEDAKFIEWDAFFKAAAECKRVGCRSDSDWRRIQKQCQQALGRDRGFCKAGE